MGSHKRQISQLVSLLIFTLFSVNAWALQDAIVIAEKAILYADKQMSSPLGFVKRGKKIRVGEIPRNQSQVYPIIVSGKVGYIRIRDVSTEMQSLDSDRLVAERFAEQANKKFHGKYSASYLMYNSQISLDHENDELKNNEGLTWHGVSLKGEMAFSPKLDLSIIFNYLLAQKYKEHFSASELGLGAGLRIYSGKRLNLRWDNQALVIPYSSYELGDLFKKNGYGFTVGTGLSLSWRLGQNVGLETYGGLHYTKLMGFKVPSPYKSINPTFTGARLGLGLNYQF